MNSTSQSPWPYLIAIAGPSGSGKSTIANALSTRLAPLSLTILCLDHYYRDLSSLTITEREAHNFDDPEAWEFDLLLRHLQSLRDGNPIERPVYDFTTHCRRPETISVIASDTVIVEGILALHWPEMNSLYDTMIFIDEDLELCLERRLERDTQHRGRTQESVLEMYSSRVLPMNLAHVEPTRQLADIVVPPRLSVKESCDWILDRLQAG